MKTTTPPKPTHYIDLLSDYGFKRVFGSDPNKDLLIHFLNEVFQGRKRITDIQYEKNEHPGDGPEQGAVIFDLLCTGDQGEKFLIEVQREKQKHFSHRAYVYGSRLVSGLVPDGDRTEWRYQIPETYIISILENFSIDSEDKQYLSVFSTRNEVSNKILKGSSTYIFIELRNFVKTLTELRSDLDKWLYVLKNMSRMNKIPQYLKKAVFQKLFQISAYVNLSEEEKKMYNKSIKYQWDLANIIDTATEEGFEQGEIKGEARGRGEGRTEGKAEVVSNLILKSSLTDQQIAEMANMEVELVKAIRKELQ